MWRHKALLPNNPSSVRMTKTIFAPMAFPLILFIFNFEDLQIRFHREASVMFLEQSLDLSTDVQNQVHIVSNSEHPFIHEPKQFKVWRTHSTN